MLIKNTELSGLLLIEPKKFGDHRGYFMESFNADVFNKSMPGVTFCQDNESLSGSMSTLRGLHFQRPPFAQDKLVRVLAGSVLDVVVDLRKNSTTYLEHYKVKLSCENCLQLFVPKGFAHGLLTLEPNTQVAYKVSAPYSPECDYGFRWNDDTFNIDWPIDRRPILSSKDEAWDDYSEVKNPF